MFYTQRKKSDFPKEDIHEYLPGDCRVRIHDLLIEKRMMQAQLAAQIGVCQRAHSADI